MGLNTNNKNVTKSLLFLQFQFVLAFYKNVTKSLLFLQFQFVLAFFAYNSNLKQYRQPGSIQFLPTNLNV